MKLEKITDQSRRRYEDACGTAHALEILGERWALLIMRELMLGPKRFGDLRASLPGLSANVLTQRLEGLEAYGVLKRRKLPPPASVQVYELTEWGLDAEGIIKTMGFWAARSPDHDPSLPLSPVSLMMSFRTMFDADKARGADLTLEFRLGDEVFTCVVRDGELTNGRGEAERPDAVITGTPEPIAGIVYGDVDPADMVAGGALKIEGDMDAVRRFAAFFELPEKASVS
ncbi:MAG TPA: winged helix-turn-helix transcriptional regulator [Brevundimonas sp.]|jgi:DNA-binding HxlR family transcriptional regulator/putative sterol carrier protein|uniref:winged helix-turn-helix transcriptional regulator n=1 Tax=Brevundimonas sp. TaxID=1871086 RepID=UPI002ED77C6F